MVWFMPLHFTNILRKYFTIIYQKYINMHHSHTSIKFVTKLSINISIFEYITIINMQVEVSALLITTFGSTLKFHSISYTNTL